MLHSATTDLSESLHPSHRSTLPSAQKQMLLCPLSAQYWKLTCVQDEIRNFIYCSGRISRDGSWCQSVRVLIITLWWLPLRSWLYQVWDCVRTSRTWRRAEMISTQTQRHLSPWSGLDLYGDQLNVWIKVAFICYSSVRHQTIHHKYTEVCLS